MCTFQRRNVRKKKKKKKKPVIIYLHKRCDVKQVYFIFYCEYFKFKRVKNKECLRVYVYIIYTNKTKQILSIIYST